nr:transposase [Ensifer aridi]
MPDASWAHVRRKFFDLTTSPGTHPIAEETLVRIGELYDIENAIRGAPPDRRKTIRQSQSKPKIKALRRWWDKMLTELPRSSSTAEAIRYAIARWASLCRSYHAPSTDRIRAFSISGAIRASTFRTRPPLQPISMRDGFAGRFAMVFSATAARSVSLSASGPISATGNSVTPDPPGDRMSRPSFFRQV